MNQARRIMIVGVALILTVSLPARAQDFDLSWNTIDGGGVMFSKAGAFELSGTIGQVDAGTVSAGDFSLAGGFWPGAGSPPPATGACCLKDETCKDPLTREDCMAKGGIEWHEGMECKEVKCPPTGACCLDGDCEENLTEEDCAKSEGEWHQGKDCDEVQCPPPGGCNGKETISKAKCKTKRGAVKKVIVQIKNGTPGEKYTATLDSGQQVEKKAKGNGKAKFTFKGNNRPECGPNGVTVCEQLRAFNCGC